MQPATSARAEASGAVLPPHPHSPARVVRLDIWSTPTSSSSHGSLRPRGRAARFGNGVEEPLAAIVWVTWHHDDASWVYIHARPTAGTFREVNGVSAVPGCALSVGAGNRRLVESLETRWRRHSEEPL